FAFVNVAGGTPIASISAKNGANNAVYLTADGTLATQARNTLTIGNSASYNTTGNVLINPNGAGNLGIGTTNPTGLLSVGTGANSNFTVAGSGNIVTAGTFTLPNTNTLTGVSNYTEFSNGISVGGGTTNGISSSGVGTLVSGTVIGTDTFTSNTLTDSGALSILTSGNNNLTLTPNGTGNTILTSTYRSGVYVGSSTNTPAPLSISGGIGSNASLIVNNTNSGDLFTASASGATKFTVNNNGNIAATGAITGLTGITSSGTITLTGIPTVNESSVMYLNNSNQIALATTTSGTQQCLLSSGGATGSPVWGSCSGATGLTNSPFNDTTTTGVITQNNTTEDLLLGGSSTASAKFAFVNVAGETPIASISAHNGANNAVYLTADGTLATQARNTLTIGNSASYNTTGNVLINPNGAGNLGIGTTNPTGLLSVGTGANSNFTVAGSGNIVTAGTFTLPNTNTLTGVSNYTEFSNGISVGGGTTNGISSSGVGTLVSGTVIGTDTFTSNTLTDSGALSILTSGNNNLTLTPNGTGNTILTSTYRSGVYVGSSTNTPAPLSISGGIGSNASLIVNNTNSGDLFTASASGATKFTVNNNGNIAATGAITGLTGITSSGTITLTGIPTVNE